VSVVFENVHYTYQSNVEALRGVDLVFERGEVVALMGENGSGKTTLLKHMNGLLKPTVGRVLVDGVETTSASIAELSQKVGLVFQNAEDMFFESTVYNEVAFALKNFGYDEEKARKRVEWALKFFELEQYKDHSPFLLSGGEKKRLAMAIILAWSPSIICLDEPTIGQASVWAAATKRGGSRLYGRRNVRSKTGAASGVGPRNVFLQSLPTFAADTNAASRARRDTTTSTSTYIMAVVSRARDTRSFTRGSKR
jgi:energy-coupling factor transporter ATP-binding protein EcfA2